MSERNRERRGQPGGSVPPSRPGTSTDARKRTPARRSAHAGASRAPASRTPQRPPAPVERSWWRGPWLVVGAAVVIAAIVATLVLVGRGGGRGGTPSATPMPAPAAVVDAVTHIDPAVVAAVGTGGQTDKLERITGQPALTSQGMPEVLYIGADYCPFCAAQRWSLVVALGRFGTFANLHLMTSASDDVFPDTHTLTFDGSSYTSQYLAFVPVEETDRDRNTLQTPTAEQQTLFGTLDAPPYIDANNAGSIPFLDFGSRYVAIGSGYDVGVLQGLTWEQIASALHDPTSAVAKAVAGTADYITAALCALTSGRPAAVCASPAVSAVHLPAQPPSS